MALVAPLVRCYYLGGAQRRDRDNLSLPCCAFFNVLHNWLPATYASLSVTVNMYGWCTCIILKLRFTHAIKDCRFSLGVFFCEVVFIRTDRYVIDCFYRTRYVSFDRHTSYVLMQISLPSLMKPKNWRSYCSQWLQSVFWTKMTTICGALCVSEQDYILCMTTQLMVR